MAGGRACFPCNAPHPPNPVITPPRLPLSESKGSLIIQVYVRFSSRSPENPKCMPGSPINSAVRPAVQLCKASLLYVYQAVNNRQTKAYEKETHAIAVGGRSIRAAAWTRSPGPTGRSKSFASRCRASYNCDEQRRVGFLLVGRRIHQILRKLPACVSFPISLQRRGSGTRDGCTTVHATSGRSLFLNWPGLPEQPA